ncbi:hypothetical protein PG989_012774 [Apiospora arundinis]
MDPLTITTSIITLAETASKLYKFLQSIRHGDPGYAMLCIELQSLTGYIQAINKTLNKCQRNPFALAPIDEDVWKQIGIAIADCQQTISDLSALVKRIGGLWSLQQALLAREGGSRDASPRPSCRQFSRQDTHINLLSTDSTSSHQHDTLRELQQLKKSLETSSHATTNPNALLFMDKKDAYIIRNLQGLVQAARRFHTAASTAASTVYAESTHDEVREEHQHRYADSIAMSLTVPAATPAYARHMQRLRDGNTPRVPDERIQRYDDAPELQTLSYPNLLDRCHTDIVTDTKDTFEGIFSVGLEKMAQKAMQLLNFSRAEEILAQAIRRYKICDANDTYFSQLRTQHALCCFIQDKGVLNTDTIEDLIEFPGTDRNTANQLLYALALCHAHHLEYDTVHRLCKLLWDNMEDYSYRPNRTDVLKIILVIHRVSGQPLLADAIEEGFSGLSSCTSLPTALEFIVQSEELLGSLFCTAIITELEQNVVTNLHHWSRSQKLTPLQQLQAFELSGSSSTPCNEKPGGNPFEDIKTSSKKLGMPFLRWIKHSDSSLQRDKLAGNLYEHPGSPDSICSFNGGSQDESRPTNSPIDSASPLSYSSYTTPLHLEHRTSSETLSKSRTAIAASTAPTSDNRTSLFKHWSRFQARLKRRRSGENTNTDAEESKGMTELLSTPLHRVNTIQRRPKRHLNGFCEDRIPFRMGPHRNGLTYEYFGPTAVMGPYTQQEDKSSLIIQEARGGLWDRYACRVATSPPPALCSIPEVPQESKDMTAPVELDAYTNSMVLYPTHTAKTAPTQCRVPPHANTPNASSAQQGPVLCLAENNAYYPPPPPGSRPRASGVGGGRVWPPIRLRLDTTSAKVRQPSSTKPMLIYAPCIEHNMKDPPQPPSTRIVSAMSGLQSKPVHGSGRDVRPDNPRLQGLRCVRHGTNMTYTYRPPYWTDASEMLGSFDGAHGISELDGTGVS